MCNLSRITKNSINESEAFKPVEKEKKRIYSKKKAESQNEILFDNNKTKETKKIEINSKANLQILQNVAKFISSQSQQPNPLSSSNQFVAQHFPLFPTQFSSLFQNNYVSKFS